MWRSSRFPANQDSDQSISDVEEFEFRCSERCVSLDGPSKRQEQPNLALQFELLSGGINVKERKKLISEEKNAGFSSEDEVEMPIFNKDAFDVEKNNDENDYDGSAFSALWPKEHEKLISDVKQHTKFKGMCFTEGGRVRNQPNSLHVEPYHQQPVRHSIPAEEALDSPEPPQFGESLIAVEYDSLEESAANPVEGLKGKFIHESEDAVAAKGFGGHECVKYSMADLLDGLQEKNFGQYAISKRVGRKGRKRKVIVNRNESLAIVANDEDPCEVIDSGSSCDDESKYRSVGHTTQKAKKKTMADQFQEALGVGATSVNEGALFLMTKQSRACSSGLLGKLQKVIQREKEQDLDFLKNPHSEALGDEARYIDVKILSRSFEAKLTVCLCSIHGYKKSSGLQEESEEERLMKTRTIIFSSRTCSDVKLDAASYVRIYPPWKEVTVLGGSVVILATYFTQTPT